MDAKGPDLDESMYLFKNIFGHVVLLHVPLAIWYNKPCPKMFKSK
jgi:hypothetical protein